MPNDNIMGIPTKACINGLTKDDALEIKKIPDLESETAEIINDTIPSLDERITALEESSGGSGDYVLFNNVNWSVLFDNNGIALYDIKILINVPIYSNPSTKRTDKLSVVEIMKGIEYSQQIRIDEFVCYSPYNDGTSAYFIAFDLLIPDGLFWNDTQTGSDKIYYYNQSHGENPSWFNVNATFTKKTRITTFMQSGDVYLFAKNYNTEPDIE